MAVDADNLRHGSSACFFVQMQADDEANSPRNQALEGGRICEQEKQLNPVKRGLR